MFLFYLTTNIIIIAAIAYLGYKIVNKLLKQPYNNMLEKQKLELEKKRLEIEQLKKKE